MKRFLLLGLLFALPAAGYSESVYSSRTYRSSSPSVERVITSPSFDVYRTWDRRHDHLWNDRRYHWDGTEWIVVPVAVYGYRRGASAPSSTLQDDVAINDLADEVAIVHPVTRVELGSGALAIDVQRRLARRGYYHGPIDGIVGPGTRSAIAAYEADHGLEPNGLMTQEVVSSLGL